MITIFFNEDGYYVSGAGVDVTRRCTPATTDRGDCIFQPIHHSYKVLFLALSELKDMKCTNDIMVYNDSRIIDEINGYIQPLDSTCEQWVKVIKRDVIPAILPVVLFRKKNTGYIQQNIDAAQKNMLTHVDRQSMVVKQHQVEESRKKKLLNKFRQSWLGANDARKTE